MGKFKNLSNLKFGKITVKDTYKIEKKKTFWLVECSCGEEKWMRADYITSGKEISCGNCESNNIIGKKFGELTVVKKTKKRTKKGATIFECKCSCGNIRFSDIGHLKDGHANKCKECYTKYPKHKYQKLLIKRYHDMLDRCYNKDNKSYHNYGGRGIVVCNEWRDDYMKFREWALSNGFEKGLQLDRIKVNGNYSPENCRWVTQKENSNNKRNNVVIEGMTLAEISEKYNVNYKKIWARQNSFKKRNPNKQITLEDLIR